MTAATIFCSFESIQIQKLTHAKLSNSKCRAVGLGSLSSISSLSLAIKSETPCEFLLGLSRSGNNFQEIIEGWLDNRPDQDKHLIGSGFASDVV